MSRELALTLVLMGLVGFGVGYVVHSCDCSLPATTGAGQGALDRG